MTMEIILSLLLLLMLPPTNAQAIPQPCTVQPVIVVGAGMSGLAAARELVARGCKVKLLEARDYIGGRTISTNFAGEQVDLHAAHIHTDSLRNSIYWLASEVFDIETNPTGGTSWFRGEEVAKWIRADGTNLTEDEIDKGYDLLDRLYDTEAWNLALDYEASPLFDTALKFVEQQAVENMKTGNGNTATIESQFDADLLDFHIASYFDLDWGLSRLQHSVKGFSTDWDFIDYNNGQDRNFPGGVQQVVNALNASIPDDNFELELNAVVTKVRYGDDYCAIETDNGNTQDTQAASACILTIPLAVMKDKTDLFWPELPNDKARAIDRTGIGGLNKVFVKWKENFWGTDVAYYIVDGDRSNPFSYGFHTGELFGRNGSTVTEFFFGGDDFAFGGENTKNNVKEAIVDVMSSAFPIAGVTKNDIEDILITNHRDDPFQRGSYSAPRVYMEGDADRQILARPIGHTLFFAGEHTNVEGRYQTMDGAYDTGIRAAGEVAAAEQNVNAGVSQNAVHKNPNQPGNRRLNKNTNNNKKPNGPVFPGHGLSQATKSSGKFRNRFNKT